MGWDFKTDPSKFIGKIYRHIGDDFNNISDIDTIELYHLNFYEKPLITDSTTMNPAPTIFAGPDDNRNKIFPGTYWPI